MHSPRVSPRWLLDVEIPLPAWRAIHGSLATLVLLCLQRSAVPGWLQTLCSTFALLLIAWQWRRRDVLRGQVEFDLDGRLWLVEGRCRRPAQLGTASWRLGPYYALLLRDVGDHRRRRRWLLGHRAAADPTAFCRFVALQRLGIWSRYRLADRSGTMGGCQ
ncbi:MAG: hypothetical protein R3E77_07315 [Steroidobacteraceae bacterium]